MPTNSSSKQLKRREVPVPVEKGESGEPAPAPFWKTKTLEEMTTAEWESLCDGCGQCCLIKLEDEDTGDIAITRLACRLLDIGSCKCTSYPNRQDLVPDCLQLEPGSVKHLDWLPDTCGYRLVAEGRDLLWWHPLVSGSAESVHEAGASVRHFAISEAGIQPERYPSHIAGWIRKAANRRRRKDRGPK